MVVVENGDRPAEHRPAVHVHVQACPGRYSPGLAAAGCRKRTDELVAAVAVAPMLYERMPWSGRPRAMRNAPARRRESGYVLMSVGLRMRELQSPPTTRHRSLAPDSTYAAPVTSAYMNPAHSRLQVHRRAHELQPILEGHVVDGNELVRRERSDEQTGRCPAGSRPARRHATVDRFEAQVAGRLLGPGVAALVDAVRLTIQSGIEPEPVEQLPVCRRRRQGRSSRCRRRETPSAAARGRGGLTRSCGRHRVSSRGVPRNEREGGEGASIGTGRIQARRAAGTPRTAVSR